MRYSAVIFLILLSYSAFCQRLSLLVGPQVSFPTGDLQASAGTGLGIFGRYDYDLSERFKAIGSIDGIIFSEKSTNLISVPSTTLKSSVGIVTGQLGGLFNFVRNTSGSKLYASGELGLSELRLTIRAGSNTVASNDYYFCYRYGIGYSVKRFDLIYSQQFISNGSSLLNYFSLRAAYRLYFHKKNPS
jgi:hypothetical protein